ncbi:MULTISPECIES: glycoside hydrolase family 76 protein [Niastella]|uniref:Glycosyl hydrolase n=1 Tax=Niastella soli TaxID=2821487 RepID=A0ABS3Z0P3_9BACT|nr:glycoside hydrolase family 76 protein [Niastella soli]MBO9203245.1 glycosyl hydrolase [Niastella soli]
MNQFLTLLALSILSVTTAFSQSVKINWSKAADSAQQALTTQFWSKSQNYFLHNNNGNDTFDYWWNAHALDVLANGFTRTKDPAYTARMSNLLTGIYNMNGSHWANKFYDDMEWLALACLHAYDVTNDSKYKEVAEILWDNINAGWTNIHGGGIMWQSGMPDSKNACSNGPAIIIAAKLYKLNKAGEDLSWAKKIYQWQEAYLVDTSRGVVWDAFGNYKETGLYTYNQGTWLGAALELYTITKDNKYLQDALKTANYIIKDQQKFAPNGILKDEGAGDGGLFKGIFISYLNELIRLKEISRSTRNEYIQFLKTNGESLLTKATYRPDYIFNSDWSAQPKGPKTDGSIQLSACMLLEALAGL